MIFDAPTKSTRTEINDLGDKADKMNTPVMATEKDHANKAPIGIAGMGLLTGMGPMNLATGETVKLSPPSTTGPSKAAGSSRALTMAAVYNKVVLFISTEMTATSTTNSASALAH